MEDAIKVLQGIKDSYETYHHVRISNEAITAAVKLSVRYIQDKWLPDKAIDLIDEGAARLRIRRPANPLDEAYRDLTEKIKAVQQDKKTEADLRSQLAQLEKRITKEDQLVLGTVSAEDIATVVARITKIPIQNLLAPEKKNLLNLANILNEHVVGQTEATTAVAEFIRRSGAGLTQADRPIGSFLFLGPSGVGKTELAKTLAATVFGDEKSLIRLDMSEFSEPFTASKLIGAPAGYVGYKEGSKLIDQVRHRPYSLILFDEIEKAHRDIFNVLLQILDEGHLTDATGKQVNFKNTIIIMTSNIGLREFQDHAALGFNSAHTTTITPGYDVVKDKVLQELNRQFRPEFLNRIDKTIVFKPLDLTAIQQIVELQLKELSDRAKEKSLTLTYTKQLVKHIAAIGYTPQQGARAIRRTIQEHIENRLAEYMLADKAKAGNTVAIGFRNGAINLTVK
jgi:ATP-dependent Clp protease ATP-binding subunit ClpC